MDLRYPLNCRKQEQKMSTGDKVFMNVLLRFLYISGNILSVTRDSKCILNIFCITKTISFALKETSWMVDDVKITFP